MNFADKLISIGFKHEDFPCWDKVNFNPKDNWLGLSKYHPDIIFKKGDIRIFFSLQGMLCKETYEEYFRYKELYDSGSVKYISIYKKDQQIYLTFTGECPSDEFINEHLNA